MDAIAYLPGYRAPLAHSVVRHNMTVTWAVIAPGYAPPDDMTGSSRLRRFALFLNTVFEWLYLVALVTVFPLIVINWFEVLGLGWRAGVAGMLTFVLSLWRSHTFTNPRQGEQRRERPHSARPTHTRAHLDRVCINCPY